MIVFEYFSHITSKLNQHGFYYVARRAAIILLSFIYSRQERFYCYSNLPIKINPYHAMNATFKFCVFSSHQDIGNDIKAQLLSTAQFDESELIQRFHDNHVCFVALDPHNHVAHYCWVCFKKRVLDIFEYCIDLEHDEAFLYNGITFPDFRGKSIYPWMLFEIQIYLSGKNFKNVYADVRSTNTPSIKGLLKAGFKIKHTIVFSSILRVYKLITISQTTWEVSEIR